jgi:hypothetical protein
MQTGEIIIVGTPWTFLLRIQILKVRSQTDFFSFLAQLLCMSVSSDPNYLYSTFISASSPFDGGAGQFPGTRRDGVSAMWFLPDEVLVDILDRLAPCSLAVSRGWRMQGMARHRGRYHLLRADLLPLSIGGIFISLIREPAPPEFFAPPCMALKIASKLENYVVMDYSCDMPHILGCCNASPSLMSVWSTQQHNDGHACRPTQRCCPTTVGTIRILP